MPKKAMDELVEFVHLRERLGNYENVVSAFKACDINKDGYLTWQELHGLLAALYRNPGDRDAGEKSLARLKGKGWTESHTLALSEAIDRDGNGKIDIEEFLDYIFPRSPAGEKGGLSQYEQMMALFRKFDKDRNGRLDASELTSMMKSLRPEWTEANTKEIFGDVDVDGSGYIESAEFINWVFGAPSERRMSAAIAERHASERDAITSQRRFEGRQSGRGVGKLDILERAGRSSVQIGESNVLYKGRTSVNFGVSEKHDGRSHTGGKTPVVVVEFKVGKGFGETKAKICDNAWNQMLGGLVRTKVEIDRNLKHMVFRVSARNGQVVLWEHGMVMYRDDPFKNDATTVAWAKEVANRDLPRLIDGAYVAAGL